MSKWTKFFIKYSYGWNNLCKITRLYCTSPYFLFQKYFFFSFSLVALLIMQQMIAEPNKKELYFSWTESHCVRQTRIKYRREKKTNKWINGNGNKTRAKQNNRIKLNPEFIRRNFIGNCGCVSHGCEIKIKVTKGFIFRFFELLKYFILALFRFIFIFFFIFVAHFKGQSNVTFSEFEQRIPNKQTLKK